MPDIKPETKKKTTIVIRGARVHNLKNIDLELPRGKFIVVSGVSGSGKSSLAFDTIYAEGHRRYVESLSAYARQFLSRMEKPDVDFIQGISPAMAIQQKNNTRNPRSTVGTTTEIYDYLRLLFARIGKTYCSNCGQVVTKDSPRSIVDHLSQLPTDTRAFIVFPLHGHKGKSVGQELKALQERGFFRLIHQAKIIDLNETKKVTANKEDLFVLVDRVKLGADSFADSRLADSAELAMREGLGRAAVILTSGDIRKFSNHFECANCHIEYKEPTPQMFSFNNPVGACNDCQGFGNTMGIDEDLVIPDSTKKLSEGAIHPFTTPVHAHHQKTLLDACRLAGIPTHKPWFMLEPDQRQKIWDGFGDFIGIDQFFEELKKQTYKIHYRVFLSRYRGYTKCHTCHGSRIIKDALLVKIAGKNIHEITRQSIKHAFDWFENLTFSDYEQTIAKPIYFEIHKRLKYLNDVGLHYLTLDRLANTLSGGEAQRINLSTSLGSSLVGSLYVLDEPSIGLHQRDSARLVNILRALQGLGNTVLVVEHDPEIIQAADWIVDMGPRAGEHGGEVVYSGEREGIYTHETSLTGHYLSGRKTIPVPEKRRPVSIEKLHVQGAMQNNLKAISVDIPLKNFVCVTGVSGSGKSTLIHDVVFAALKKNRGGYSDKVGRYQTMSGDHLIDQVEMVDQSPIGRSPRSNPVTYLKIFDDIRQLFAVQPQSKVRGYTPGTFSFNIPGGRCEACQGEGIQTIEMQFLADIQLTCESCKGDRYKKEVLEVKADGLHISQVLNLTIDEGVEFFRKYRKIKSKLMVLQEVGLGYLRLGQGANTLSGGEAQRLKLASHLVEKEKNATLFFFDEPTTGLHFDDIQKLIIAFNRLIDQGHGVVVIEHNLDIIKCADYIIDLGPEGGDEGGHVVATGTPEAIAKVKESHTGRYLQQVLTHR